MSPSLLVMHRSPADSLFFTLAIEIVLKPPLTNLNYLDAADILIKDIISNIPELEDYGLFDKI